MKNALRISLLLIALLFLLAWRFAPARQASDEPEPSGEVRRPMPLCPTIRARCACCTAARSRR